MPRHIAPRRRPRRAAAASAGFAVLIALVGWGLAAGPAAAAPESGSVVPLAEAPPVAQDDEYSMAYNTVLVVPTATGILANDTSLPVSPDYTRVTDADHNAANSFSPDGSFSYTPDAGFVGDDQYTYCITATFGGGGCLSNTATILIHVIGPPPVPVATDDSYSIVNGSALNALILDNDLDRPSPSSYKVVTALAHAQVSEFMADGHIAYVADAGFVGADSFSYCITAVFGTGECLSNVATVSIEVQAPPPPPAVGDDAYSTPAGSVLSVSAPGILANDEYLSDEDGAFVVITGFAHAAAVDISGDGSLMYLPEPGFSGVDTATYCLTGGSETSTCISSIATITITVIAAPVPVPAASAEPPLPVAAVAPPSLAATGSRTLVPAAVGALCAVIGAAMLASARRRPSRIVG